MTTKNLLPDVLSSITVSDVIYEQDLVHVWASDTLDTVVTKLTAASISSVPVFKKSPSSSSEEITDDTSKASLPLDQCVGVVDYANITRVVADLRKRGFHERDPRKHIWTAFSQQRVDKTITFNSSPYIQISVKATLLQAVEQCAEFKLRRLLAVDETNQVVGVLSSSQMIKHLVDAVGEDPETTLDKKMESLAIGGSPVITVKKRDSLESAFKRMIDIEISAIGIVDDVSGALQGSISMSDVCLLIQQKDSSFLGKTVWKYLTYIKDQEVDAKFPFFSVTKESSLKSVMSRLVATAVHHLYIIDAEGKPEKVVTFSDICRGLLTYKYIKP